MDIRTNEIFDFKNKQELDKAKQSNPFLREVNCKQLCGFREMRGEKFFCIANRSQRRRIKCQIKKVEK